MLLSVRKQLLTTHHVKQTSLAVPQSSFLFFFFFFLGISQRHLPLISISISITISIKNLDLDHVTMLSQRKKRVKTLHPGATTTRRYFLLWAKKNHAPETPETFLSSIIDYSQLSPLMFQEVESCPRFPLNLAPFPQLPLRSSPPDLPQQG